MSAQLDLETLKREGPMGLTLLELVTAISEQTQSEAETVAVVYRLICTGRVRLTGNFKEYFRRFAN